MILTELSPVPVTSLPVAEFREHLRLGTGFEDDAVQDTVLEASLRAALAAIEAKTGKVLLERAFLWKLTAWRGFQREELPVAPVSTLTSAKIIESDGSETPLPATSYVLEEDAIHPTFAARGFGLPTVPVAGSVEIEFVAGYANDWTSLPADLAQAVMILSAEFHEHRHDHGSKDAFPTRVLQLIAPYRPVRLFGRRR
ncbi:MAG: hypothetical protein AAF566_02965 [Pseudomonadota bacterium]